MMLSSKTKILSFLFVIVVIPVSASIYLSVPWHDEITPSDYVQSTSQMYYLSVPWHHEIIPSDYVQSTSQMYFVRHSSSRGTKDMPIQHESDTTFQRPHKVEVAFLGTFEELVEWGEIDIKTIQVNDNIVLVSPDGSHIIIDDPVHNHNEYVYQSLFFTMTGRYILVYNLLNENHEVRSQILRVSSDIPEGQTMTVHHGSEIR